MFLFDIWNDQPSGYFAISSRKGKEWQDHFFTDLAEVKSFLDKSKAEGNCDLYFCTTTLRNPKRVKENVLPSKYLWQDLDEVDPRKLPDNLRPTIAWQSSPNRYQALWKLDKHYEPEEIEELNKKLATATKADKGSWILTKVLRIPGTRNMKYPDRPIVKSLWDNGPTYKYDTLLKQLGGRTKEKKEEESESVGTLEKYWSRIPHKIRKLLTASQAPVGKRSDTLWYIEHELMKAEFNTNEIYHIVKDSIWNKYKDRRDEKIRITEEIAKVFEHEMIPPDGPEAEESIDEGLNEPVMHLVLENDLDLMTNMTHYPGWLVEGFWTRNSHGIIAGEPKSFKSTLSLDLAVSVASATPFLGQFEVSEPGPVLIVQNENAAWIMKDRLNKIRHSKELAGEIIITNKYHYQVKFPPALPIYYINQQGFSFDNDFHKQILIKIMRQIRPVLVIFDPLYLMFAGDVNTSKDLNPILTWLLSLKNQFQCSLILIHHWKKGTIGTKMRGGQRLLGSTVLHGWVESAWYIEVKGMVEEEESSKKHDVDSIKSPSADIKLVLEREFRGAGTYPKVDMEIHMGEFNVPDYSIKLERHSARGRKLTTAVKGEVERDVKNFLELRKGRKISNREIARELGLSRKTVEDIILKMQEKK